MGSCPQIRRDKVESSMVSAFIYFVEKNGARMVPIRWPKVMDTYSKKRSHLWCTASTGLSKGQRRISQVRQFSFKCWPTNFKFPEGRRTQPSLQHSHSSLNNLNMPSREVAVQRLRAAKAAVVTLLVQNEVETASQSMLSSAISVVEVSQLLEQVA